MLSLDCNGNIKEIEFIVGGIDGVRLIVRRDPAKTPILKSFLIICDELFVKNVYIFLDIFH